MLSIEASRRGIRLTNGVSRREVLRVGATTLGGLTLPSLLRLESAAKAAAAGSGNKTKFAKSVIVFSANGGAGQMDSFDPKPDAPEETRGPWGTVPTSIPGVRYNELLPQLAKLAHKCTLLRAVRHEKPETTHPGAIYLSLCGRNITRPLTAEAATGSREDRPTFGSVVGKILPAKKELPSFVLLPGGMGVNGGGGNDWPGISGGFLGAGHDPYRINASIKPGYSPGALAADPDLSADRVAGRKDLLAAIGHQAEYLNAKAATQALDPHYAKAFDIISSPAAQKAFDLSGEPQSTHDRYGTHIFGQSCILARRLVEAGVRVVQVVWSRSDDNKRVNFDTHLNMVPQIKNDLYPPLDKGYSALLEDLDERGLLDDTLVLWSNEFGRTPKINRAQGRDHWPFCYSLLLAGGGLKAGAVYGASDKIAAYPAADPVSPQDVLATLFHRLGVDLETHLYDPLNRPHRLVEGTPIQAIM